MVLSLTGRISVSFVTISFLIAKPTPASLLSPSDLPLQRKEYSKSLRLPESENLVSHRVAMSLLYLASSIATSVVRLCGRSAPSRSRRVLIFHCPIVPIHHVIHVEYYNKALLLLLLLRWKPANDQSRCIQTAYDQSLHGRHHQHAQYCHETGSHCNHHEQIWILWKIFVKLSTRNIVMTTQIPKRYAYLNNCILNNTLLYRRSRSSS